MKYTVLISLLMIGCHTNPNNIKIGMVVTNGYCQGLVTSIFGGLGEVGIHNAVCANGTYMVDFITLPLEDCKEVK